MHKRPCAVTHGGLDKARVVWHDKLSVRRKAIGKRHEVGHVADHRFKQALVDKIIRIAAEERRTLRLDLIADDHAVAGRKRRPAAKKIVVAVKRPFGRFETTGNLANAFAAGSRIHLLREQQRKALPDHKLSVRRKPVIADYGRHVKTVCGGKACDGISGLYGIDDQKNPSFRSFVTFTVCTKKAEHEGHFAFFAHKIQ